MSQSAPVPVVIACPYCGTRYQIPYGAIGAKGRNVLCAQCGRSWEAHAEAPAAVAPPPPSSRPAIEPEKDFDALAEEMLDEKFVIEEQRQKARREAALRAQVEEKAARVKSRAAPEADANARAEAAVKAEMEARAAAIALATEATKAAGAPADAARPVRSPEHQRTLDDIRAAVGSGTGGTAEPDPTTRLFQQHAFSRRQQVLRNKLPMARLRRLVRLSAAGLLVLLIGGGVLARGPLVLQFPQLAAPYAAIGLPVNVIGLEFRNVHTLQSLQQGSELLAVEGDITSVAGHEVPVPEVIITLLGAEGRALYEWSMTPKAQELEPGEHLSFSTQLTQPPAGAREVRLSFAAGSAPPRGGEGGGAPNEAAGAAALPSNADGPIIFAKTPGASELGQNPAR
jgi:predicted Zn finger-like uncharacterized protein